MYLEMSYIPTPPHKTHNLCNIWETKAPNHPEIPKNIFTTLHNKAPLYC